MSNVVVSTVTREQAVAVLEALGVTTAKKLTVERIAKKLSNLKTLVEKAGANLSAQPPEVLAIIQDVTNGASVKLKAEKQVKKEKAPEPEPEKPSEKAMRLTDGGKKEPKEKKEKKPAAKKEKAPKAPSRQECSAQALPPRGETIIKVDLIAKADKLYQSNGGNGNIKEAASVMRLLLPALETLRIVRIDGDTIKVLR